MNDLCLFNISFFLIENVMNHQTFASLLQNLQINDD